MNIQNINDNYGDCVEFDNVFEMAAAISNTESLEMPDCTVDDLTEGIDYEYI